MTRVRALALSLLIASPAAAQTPPPPAATIEPGRLALATTVVDKVFPVGTYKRLMGGTMDRLIAGIVDAAGTMPIRQLAALGGLSEAQARELPDTSLAQITAIYDPDYRERTRLTMRVMMDAMSGVMTRFEPRVRVALARAYARRFDVAQLTDLDTFFRTPTGALYAHESMAIYMDPELLEEMQSLTPELLDAMPAILKQAEAATASLPKPRRIADLSDADRRKLAALLGVKPVDLKDPPATTLSTTSLSTGTQP